MDIGDLIKLRRKNVLSNTLEDRVRQLRSELATGQITMSWVELRHYLGCEAAALVIDKPVIAHFAEFHRFLIGLERWDFRLALYALFQTVYYYYNGLNDELESSLAAALSNLERFIANEEPLRSLDSLSPVAWSIPNYSMLRTFWDPLVKDGDKVPFYLSDDTPEIVRAKAAFFVRHSHFSRKNWIYNHTTKLEGRWQHFFNQERMHQHGFLAEPASDKWKPPTTGFRGCPRGKHSLFSLYFDGDFRGFSFSKRAEIANTLLRLIDQLDGLAHEI